MTQRTKNRILIVAGILLLSIAYQYGIAKTIRIRKQVASLEQQKQTFQNAARALNIVSHREKQLDTMLAKHKLKGNSIQQHLLKTLHTLADTSNFKIIAFEKPHHHQDAKAQQTTTYQFTIAGDYQSIMNTIYALEQQYSFGNIIHVDFQKKKDYKTKKVTLHATVSVQRLQ